MVTSPRTGSYALWLSSVYGIRLMVCPDSGCSFPGESWGSNGSGGPVKSSRGGAKPRSHPYGGGRGGY